MEITRENYEMLIRKSMCLDVIMRAHKANAGLQYPFEYKEAIAPIINALVLELDNAPIEKEDDF